MALLGVMAATLALSSEPAPAQSRADYCGVEIPPVVELPPERAKNGRYVNLTYGYSVQLSPGQRLYTAQQGPERGFVLVLSSQPRAFIRVDAAYDVFYDLTAEGVHRRDLNTIRLHDTLRSDEPALTRLAGEPAQLSLVRLVCRGDAVELVHEAIIAVRRREIYRLDLQTTPERLPGDARMLSALADSWRWEAVR